MKTFNRLTGQIAENYALKALIKKGYTIIKRNFRTRYGEIDIIAKDKQTLVFIEVKAKIGTSFGIPEEMITKKKLEKIKMAAGVYLDGRSPPSRIDVVAIVLSPDRKISSLRHYQNIY